MNTYIKVRFDIFQLILISTLLTIVIISRALAELMWCCHLWVEYDLKRKFNFLEGFLHVILVNRDRLYLFEFECSSWGELRKHRPIPSSYTRQSPIKMLTCRNNPQNGLF